MDIDDDDVDTEAYIMLNALIRIAKDLERVIVAIYMCAGLLGLIAFVLILRMLTR